MNEAVPGIVPVNFELATAEEFDYAIVSHGGILIEARIAIALHDKGVDDTIFGPVVKDTPVDDVMRRVMATHQQETGSEKSFGLEEEQEVTREEYVDALWNRLAAGMSLAGYTSAWQKHIDSNTVEIYPDKNERELKAWRATWNRMHSSLKAVGSDAIAPIAEFFDQLVAIQYPTSYDPTDWNRGNEARLDVASFTFYEVFKNHLTRVPGE